MRLVAAAVLLLLASTLSAAEQRDVSTAVGVRARPAMIKIMTHGSEASCRGHGTAFFIQPDGLALTAGHVIPSDCPDLIIRAQVEGETETSEAILVKRSALDGALIKVSGATSRRYLPLHIVSSPKEVAEYQDKFVTVVGFDLPDEPKSYATQAQITAVQIEGDSDRWSLAMSSPNPGRSGSPVMLDDGFVVAVLVELPKINQSPAQGRARIIPLARLTDLDVPVLARQTEAVQAQSLRVNFAVSEGIDGHQKIDDQTVAMKGIEVIDVGTNKGRQIQLAARGYNLRRRVTRDVRFKPTSGYKFVLESVRFSPLTVSPLDIEPKQACPAGVKRRCWELVDGELVIHFEFFPGNFDGARSWIEGEFATEQIRAANR